MSEFARQQTVTYISAVLADMSTQTILNGISEKAAQLDWADTFLNGLQTATGFIAYPIAFDVLEKTSKKYRQIQEKKTLSDQVLFYGVTSATASAILTGVNYPISKVQQARKDGKVNASVNEVVKFYFDGILPTAGFLVFADKIADVLPPTKNSLGSWINESAINSFGALGSTLFNLPVSLLRDKTPLLTSINNWKSSLIPGIIMQDTFSHFNRVFKSLA